MRVMTNGVMREVYVLKHFKIGAEEYVLYKNNENVSIGFIQDNKITAPDGTKLPVLMKVLSNLISPTPNAEINAQNGCVELDKSFVNTLEEVSFQNVNIPAEQLDRLMNGTQTPVTSIIGGTPIETPIASPLGETIASGENTETPKEGEEAKPEIPKDNRMKIYGIIIVVLALILGVLLFKDKIFKSGGSGGNSPTPAPVVTVAPVNDNAVTTLSIYDLTDIDQDFTIGGTVVKIKAVNNKILVNDQEVVDYTEQAKVYVTNKFIILVNVGQYEMFVKAVNEKGEIIEVTGLQSAPSELIQNLRVENGKLIADRSNETDPNAGTKNVEFAYENNQIVIREIQ